MSTANPHRPFYLAGPTGSGKNSLALALARRFPVEIVNADAFQLYRGINIVTASPPEGDREICPHHLYGVLDPAEACDAGRFLDLAGPVLADIVRRGRIPLVTGGSGLYLKALTHGLDDAVPPVDPAVRAALQLLSLEQICERLANEDPASLHRIGPHNRRYLQRALEISVLAGRPASHLRKTWASHPPGLRGILLERPRADLFERIDRRVVGMFESGAPAEVAAVSSWSPTSLQAIGVREIQALLRGDIDRESCIRLIQQATRRYARRQLTWFRREPWLRPLAPPPDDDWESAVLEISPLFDG